MRATRIVLGFATAAVLASGPAACGGSPTEAERVGLVGRWEWVRATGGIAGVVRTPESEGYTLEIRFLAGGTVELRRDGELRVRTAYELRAPSDQQGASDHHRVVYGEPVLDTEWQLLVRSDAEALVLADPCCDRFRWEFRPAG